MALPPADETIDAAENSQSDESLSTCTAPPHLSRKRGVAYHDGPDLSQRMWRSLQALHPVRLRE